MLLLKPKPPQQEARGQERGRGAPAAPKVASVVVMAARFDSTETVAMLDSGANEVVMPYNKGWWDAVQAGRARGKRTAVTLARGAVNGDAVFIGGGEVMIKRAPKQAGVDFTDVSYCS